MTRKNYKIIFKKVAEIKKENEQEDQVLGYDLIEEDAEELEEIRRLTTEIQNPEPQLYTTT